MRAHLLLVVAVAIVAACKPSARADDTRAAGSSSAPAPAPAGGSIYDLTVRRLDGSPAPLSTYRGKVALLVKAEVELPRVPRRSRGPRRAGVLEQGEARGGRAAKRDQSCARRLVTLVELARVGRATSSSLRSPDSLEPSA